ncbi:hypothetical protein, partial [Escherichia coli]
SGRGGVALLMMCAGRPDTARRLLAEINDDPAARVLPGLYFGAAGLGLLNLHAWRSLRDPAYLEAAARIGDALLQQGQRGA